MHPVAPLNAAGCKHRLEQSQKREALLWLVSLTWARVLRMTDRQFLGTGHSVSYVFQMEIFASINWVSEQRLRHLTSIYFATPPPATAPSLFFPPFTLS